jgi:hypothetical protein
MQHQSMFGTRRRAVWEMTRVLRPGGFLHVVVPFCHPFHAYPSDCHRWTTRGQRELLPASQCIVPDEGIRTGPTATMLSFVCEYCRILSHSKFGESRVHGGQPAATAIAIPRPLAESQAECAHSGQRHLHPGGEETDPGEGLI